MPQRRLTAVLADLGYEPIVATSVDEAIATTGQNCFEFILLDFDRDGAASAHSLDDLRTFTTAPIPGNIPRLVTEAGRRQWRRHFSLTRMGTLAGLAVLAVTAWWLAHGNEQLVWLVTRGRV